MPREISVQFAWRYLCKLSSMNFNENFSKMYLNMLVSWRKRAFYPQDSDSLRHFKNQNFIYISASLFFLLSMKTFSTKFEKHINYAKMGLYRLTILFVHQKWEFFLYDFWSKNGEFHVVPFFSFPCHWTVFISNNVLWCFKRFEPLEATWGCCSLHFKFYFLE